MLSTPTPTARAQTSRHIYEKLKIESFGGWGTGASPFVPLPLRVKVTVVYWSSTVRVVLRCFTR